VRRRNTAVRSGHAAGPMPDVMRRKLMLHAAQLAGATLSIPLLSACGGSSDSDGTSPPPPPPAVPPSVLVTPEVRFAQLADYPFAPNYVTVNNLRMHYVDQGPKQATHTFLCLHGEPTWSYLYRKMIPVFAAAGHRVIAPDLVGFGKSDKPIADTTHTFTFHREQIMKFIQQLDLRNVTLVVQDWGGLLGLTVPPAMPDRFARLVIMNTMFATGEPLDPSLAYFTELNAQRRARWSQITDVDITRLILQGSKTATPTVAAAYDAPFPDPSYEAGARRFPQIIPLTPQEDGAIVSKEALNWWSNQWQGKSFMAVGVQDELLGLPVMKVMRTLIRNCPPPLELPNAGHFIQEDGGIEVAEAALRAFG
jgi:pimeloyl-ACP methyl ester carboxylesterase